jgi:hypothetical protein
MTKKDKQDWQKRKDLESVALDPKPWEGLAVHSQNTAKHEFVKFCLCYLLDRKDRAWDSEVQFSTGRCDVLDLGPEDGDPLVYEVETGVTPTRKKEKIAQYMVGSIRDVIVIDPASVPDEFGPAIEYLDTHHVIG